MAQKHPAYLWIVLILATGCATQNGIIHLTSAQKTIINKLTTDELAVHSEIKEIDLDKDGKVEAVVICGTSAHSSVAKVIKFNNEEAEIIFEHYSNTPATEFKIINGLPTLTFEKSLYIPDYATAKRQKEIYQCDGKNWNLL